MNAGKTTTMLQSAHNYRERGMRPLLMKPALDTRDKISAISSRIGLRADAVGFDASADLLSLVRDDITANGPLNCVLCDEAQFLSADQVWQLSDVVDELRIPVLCYGLRTDFRGALFPGSETLLAIADELVEIKTICHSGKKATMNLRVDDSGAAVLDGPQVEIGGNERYVSVSRAEFKKVMSGEARVGFTDC